MFTRESQPGPSCFHVERGEDPRTLIVAFAGVLPWTDKVKFAFKDLCARLGYSRILLCDPYRLCYMRGVGPTPSDFQSVLDRVRREIDRLSPERMVFLGESIGGHAAILAGHLLRADSVHAFAPFTYLNLSNILASRDWTALRQRRRVIAGLYFHAWRNRHLFDLRRLLSQPNGITRYYVHVCRARRRESRYANHILGVPGVHVIPHPKEIHLVANYMIRQKILMPWLHLSNGSLDLSNTRATDDDLESVKAIPTLASLDLRGTKVTSSGIADLRNALPDLAVVF